MPKYRVRIVKQFHVMASDDQRFFQAGEWIHLKIMVNDGETELVRSISRSSLETGVMSLLEFAREAKRSLIKHNSKI